MHANKNDDFRELGDPGNSSGWDPYEIWRERVLMPRLERDQGLEQAAPEGTEVDDASAA